MAGHFCVSWHNSNRNLGHFVIAYKYIHMQTSFLTLC
nr:MAG TPA: hypothetical protein [Caudoviricetes sp.]DAY29090.1 MAG TPA: hypothetical protein [Caudoviricetes sp.]